MIRTEHSKKNPEATFLMGGSGSGKGYIRNRDFSHIKKVLDCDEIKKRLPNYDPKNPQGVHEESRQLLVREFFNSLSKGEDFIYDGTGTNAEKYMRMMNQAQEAGFFIRLVFVRCPLKTALRRNAQRDRVVPEHIVREKHSSIEQAFDLIVGYADESIVINNG